MKKGLILEGGGMKGMYTAGVLDVFLEKNIKFDGIVGVSAGALFGVNFLSKQHGRVIRYNKKFNSDKNYMGIRPYLKTGNVVDTKYAYFTVPRELDIFDDEEYQKSNVPFYAVVTNVDSGKAEYINIKSAFDQMDTLRASGSMPLLSQPVEIDGQYYLDGAIADSIPYEFMMEKGYDDLTVVLTKPAGYVKKPMPKLLVNMKYKKKYPKLAESVKNRYKMYNAQMRKLEELEKAGKIKVIRPSEDLGLSRTESDPDRLEEQYQLGRKDAIKFLEENNI